VFVLHDDERHVHLLLQHGHDGYVQGGNDGNGVQDDLHQRRQELRKDDSGLLRLHECVHDARLHLLHDDERHADVLLHDVIRSISGSFKSIDQHSEFVTPAGLVVNEPFRPGDEFSDQIGDGLLVSRLKSVIEVNEGELPDGSI